MNDAIAMVLALASPELDVKAITASAGNQTPDKTLRTVLRMLLMCLRQANGPLRIRLAAPTGKAAQRLRQSLQDGLQQLRDLDPSWQDALASLRDLQAETVHRLLAWSPRERRSMLARFSSM